MLGMRPFIHSMWDICGEKEHRWEWDIEVNWLTKGRSLLFCLGMGQLHASCHKDAQSGGLAVLVRGRCVPQHEFPLWSVTPLYHLSSYGSVSCPPVLTGSFKKSSYSSVRKDSGLSSVSRHCKLRF